MKDIFAKNNIPTAKYLQIENTDKFNLDGLKYPLVVKPADCNSSKGVKKVYGGDSLYIAVKNALNLSRSHKCVVEEFKEGRELSADFWLFDDKARLIGLSENIKGGCAENFTIAKSYYNPINITKSRVNALENIALKIGDAFGLKNTPLLAQVIENDEGLFVLEFSARMGGGGKHRFIRMMSGVDIINAFLDMALYVDVPADFKIKFDDREMEIDYIYM